MAPVLSFTAEEVWKFIPQTKEHKESVFLTTFPKVRPQYQDEKLAERWGKLLSVRKEVTKALERARREREIGHSLDAEVQISAPPALTSVLNSYLKDLAEIFIVSHVELTEKPAEINFESETIPGLKIMVKAYNYPKCERCWRRQPSVGKNKTYPTICNRCVEVMQALT